MKTVIPVAIYIITPIIGILTFLKVYGKLKLETNNEIFTLRLFIAFACLGGLLTLLFTVLFWKWSGMATIGLAFLVLIAPVLMAIIGYDSYRKKQMNQREFF